MVPLAIKREIMTKLFQTPEPIATLPASILRMVDGTLFIDRNSCPPESLPAELLALT
jgi:hypothetical protein